jgi:hypothetical protein
MRKGPVLLRRRGRRGFLRRSVFLGALIGMLLVAPSAGGVPGDPTPPRVTPVYSPTLPSNGWYRGSVTLGWLVVDDESVITKTTGCDAQTFTTDTPGTRVACTAESDGGINGQSVTIRVDRTPPAVNAIAERVADANGWYNRPLTVSYAGADGTSGLASCSPPTRYAGPDLGTASVVGSCSDKAGNVGEGVMAFKYDATAPSIFGTTATHGNRSAQISWRKSSDTKVVEVVRTPGRNGQGESGIYSGSATGFRDTGLTVGRKYEYRVIGVDEAANRAEQKFSLVATGALLSPTPGLQITMNSPPTLAWAPAKGATYYNVQLIHGRKVLSAWPLRPSFRLRRTWSYKGRRYRLKPGTYRWYVWPGYGRISAGRYSRRPLGSSTFVVTK